MAKVRVYELAKELGLESKALLTKLQEMGEFVKSASSTLEPPVVRRVRDLYPNAVPAPDGVEEAPAKKAAAKKSAKKAPSSSKTSKTDGGARTGARPSGPGAPIRPGQPGVRPGFGQRPGSVPSGRPFPPRDGARGGGGFAGAAVDRADRVDRVDLAVDVPAVLDQVQEELQVDAGVDPDKLEVLLAAVAKAERLLVHKNRERLNARR